MPTTDPQLDRTDTGGAGDDPAGALHHLRAGGVSVLLDGRDGRLPVIVHWGADLGELADDELDAVARAARPAYRDTEFDVATGVRVLPAQSASWLGRAGLEGSRNGRDFSTDLRITGETVEPLPDGGTRLITEAADPVAELAVRIELELTGAGLLRIRAELINNGAPGYGLGILRLALPVPGEADQLLDFTGRHTRERVPQRRDFTVGIHSREARNGRTGLDAAYLLVAGRHGFGFRSGEAWAVHLGWSGNQQLYAERLHNGARVLGGGEALESGELSLDTGERYVSPWLYGSWGDGLDAVSARFHRYLRSRPQHPTSPRPVILNTWEAVYFDHDLEVLTRLAERAARVGVERFVLDDGWFSGRRDDTSSLGDWTVSEQVWPDGLDPLIEVVRGHGMQFGLWVEPEMVNLDSDLARAHPEWLFSAGGRVGTPSRHQHVLDLGHAEAYAYIRDSLLALVDRYRIDYLKWDHNRLLSDAGHTPGGEPGVHRHTSAVYRLMAELKAAHPGLEIESCSAGGGRIDLGVLEVTDRVWPSDCIDALERQQIVRSTRLLLPPELLGTHIGAPEAHTTARHHALAFRGLTALWGHLGIEWDLTRLSDDELDTVRRWVALHKELRPLLHTGTVVNADHPDPAVWVGGVVAPDRERAVFGVVAVDRSLTWPPGRVRLPGLDPDTRYRVAVEPLSLAGQHDLLLPPWARTETALSGRALARAGLEVIGVHPENGYLLRLDAIG